MKKQIVKILNVIDTRQYEERGDRYVPIPGSGEFHICDRCGRIHEVRATVLLDDDTMITVGTGCMKAESTEIQSRLKSMTSASKTLKRLQAQLDTMNSKLNAVSQQNAKIEEHVRNMPYPEIVQKRPEQTEWHQYAKGTVLFMGEIAVEICPHGGQYDYRVECLKKSWTVAKQRELGWQDISRLRHETDCILDAIDRARTKIKQLLSE